VEPELQQKEIMAARLFRKVINADLNHAYSLPENREHPSFAVNMQSHGADL